MFLHLVGCVLLFCGCCVCGIWACSTFFGRVQLFFAGALHDNPRAQACTFEGPGASNTTKRRVGAEGWFPEGWPPWFGKGSGLQGVGLQGFGVYGFGFCGSRKFGQNKETINLAKVGLAKVGENIKTLKQAKNWPKSVWPKSVKELAKVCLAKVGHDRLVLWLCRCWSNGAGMAWMDLHL